VVDRTASVDRVASRVLNELRRLQRHSLTHDLPARLSTPQNSVTHEKRPLQTSSREKIPNPGHRRRSGRLPSLPRSSIVALLNLLHAFSNAVLCDVLIFRVSLRLFEAPRGTPPPPPPTSTNGRRIVKISSENIRNEATLTCLAPPIAKYARWGRVLFSDSLLLYLPSCRRRQGVLVSCEQRRA
jgi:hypothetical protein